MGRRAQRGSRAGRDLPAPDLGVAARPADQEPRGERRAGRGGAPSTHLRSTGAVAVGARARAGAGRGGTGGWRPSVGGRDPAEVRRGVVGPRGSHVRPSTGDSPDQRRRRSALEAPALGGVNRRVSGRGSRRPGRARDALATPAAAWCADHDARLIRGAVGARRGCARPFAQDALRSARRRRSRRGYRYRRRRARQRPSEA